MRRRQFEKPTEAAYRWVVVKVESGVPVSADVYRDEHSAHSAEAKLRTEINLEDDEAAVFEISV